MASEKSEYSLGRVIKQVNDHNLKLPALESLRYHCMEYYCEKWLQIIEINTVAYNLLYSDSFVYFCDFTN